MKKKGEELIVEEPSKPLEQLIEKLSTPQPCIECKQLLTKMQWNTRVDVLICDNRFCLHYHQPQGCEEINYRRTMDDVKESYDNGYRSSKGKNKAGKPKTKWGLGEDLPD